MAEQSPGEIFLSLTPDEQRNVLMTWREIMWNVIEGKED